jgi:hypothetical protein
MVEVSHVRNFSGGPPAWHRELGQGTRETEAALPDRSSRVGDFLLGIGPATGGQ